VTLGSFFVRDAQEEGSSFGQWGGTRGACCRPLRAPAPRPPRRRVHRSWFSCWPLVFTFLHCVLAFAAQMSTADWWGFDLYCVGYLFFLSTATSRQPGFGLTGASEP